jgi:hypothetical protein
MESVRVQKCALVLHGTSEIRKISINVILYAASLVSMVDASNLKRVRVTLAL